MGASNTKSTGKEKQEKLNEWREKQTNSNMIQQLSQDVDAQYLTYQPYLSLQDIINLSRTCHLWCHWIRSPGSVAHRSSKNRSNRGGVVVITNAYDLKRLIDCQWIQPYFYGCKIQPPLDYANEWANPYRVTVSRFIHPPLLTQLAALNHIQHLSLNHVHHDHITREKIAVYFKTLSSSLRSLEIWSTVHPTGQEFGHWLDEGLGASEYVNRFTLYLHLLPNLEELRLITPDQGTSPFGLLNLEQLPELAHFHTFVCTHQLNWSASMAIGRCRHLKSCSFVRAEFVTGWRMSQLYLDKFLEARPTCTMDQDPFEDFNLSTICITSNLWKLMARQSPRLHTLAPYGWQINSDDWSLLTRFTHLTSLHLVSQVSHEDWYTRKRVGFNFPLDADYFWPSLIQCTTLESLTLGHLSITVDQLRSLLVHLTRLHTLTLISIRQHQYTLAPPAPRALPFPSSLVDEIAQTLLGTRASGLRINQS